MEMSIQFLALIPVVLGVTQVFKILGLGVRFLPLVSLVLGVGAVCVLAPITGVSVIQGIVVGL